MASTAPTSAATSAPIPRRRPRVSGWSLGAVGVAALIVASCCTLPASTAGTACAPPASLVPPAAVSDQRS